MSREKLQQEDADLRRLLAQVIDSLSTRRAAAGSIPYDEPRFGRWLNGKEEGTLGVLTYCMALKHVDIDLVALLRLAIEHRKDRLPDAVKVAIFDLGPRVESDELLAIQAYAAVGGFDSVTPEEVKRFWAMMRSDAGRKPTGKNRTSSIARTDTKR